MNLPDNVLSPDHFLSERMLLNIFLLACLLLTPIFSQAKTSDINQALHIEADSVEIREQQGISIYKGHVTINRGSMLIKGQLIQVTTKKNNMYVIKVEGKPARFKQLNDSNQEISAQSQKMTFSSESGILTMDKEAILIQGQNQFTSEHIIYNTRQDVVQAGKDEATSTTEPERVSITIQPQPEKNNKNDQP
jgi:lipopolysaccharide export system protein LptA